jgi:hypothetical protein
LTATGDLFYDRHDLLDRLGQGVVVRFDDARVRRHLQGRSRARAVDAIAATQLVFDPRQRFRVIELATLLSPPPSSLLDRGLEVDLHVCVGQHHRADVAAGHHDAAVGRQHALERQQFLADAGVARNSADQSVDNLRVQVGRQLFAVGKQSDVAQVVVWSKVEISYQRQDCLLVVRVDSAPDGQQGQAAIEHACVTEAVAQASRHHRADRALAARTWAIDGDDQRAAAVHLASASSCLRSRAVNSRTSPRCMPVSRSVPKRTRTSRSIRPPTALNIRRNWRFQP